MKKTVLLAAVAVFSSFGLLAADFSFAAGAIEHLGLADAVVGGKPLKAGEAAKTLQGRVWSQWADNPDGELLFGIQYWNTGEPGSGTPGGRSSTMLDVKPPDPLFSCCAWGFAGAAFWAMTPGEPKHVIAETSAAAIQQSERWIGRLEEVV